MIQDIRPLSKAKVKKTIPFRQPIAEALKEYAVKTGQNQNDIVETGLQLIPGLRALIAKKQEAYAKTHQDHETKVNNLIQDIRESVRNA